MATITINIPDDKVGRVLDAFANTNLDLKIEYLWTPTINSPNGPIANPETKAQHAKRRLLEFIRLVVYTAERSPAVTSAESQVTTSVNGINLT